MTEITINELEQIVTDALERTRRFEIQGQRLMLYGEAEQALAILQAEYLF